MAEKNTDKQSAIQKLLTVTGLILCVVFSFMLVCNVAIIVKGTLHPEIPPSVFGVTPMVTLSSSMDGDKKDSFAAGDLIFTVKARADELKVDDVISFMAGSVVVTHRIVEVQTAEDGSIQWITKGDANNAEDGSPVSESKLVGKYLAHIPCLGSVVLFMQTPLGMTLFIGVPLLGFIIYDIIRRQAYADRERRKIEDLQNEILRLQALNKESEVSEAEQ